MLQIPGLSLTKHFQLRMACKVADKSERGSTGILGAFHLGNRDYISSMKAPHSQISVCEKLKEE